MGASSRVRSYQFLPYYQGAGFTCKVSPLFNDNYLQKLYTQGSVGKLNIALCYIKRLAVLFTIPFYNIVIIEKELFPYLPSTTEKMLMFLGVKYIVDYDDAIFHNYNLHPNSLIRKALQNKISHVMRNAFAVVAGNDYIASYARQSKAKEVVIIPTVINTNTYTVKQWRAGKKIVIGWIGSPTTLKYLHSLLPVFKKLIARYNIEIHIVGGQKGIGLDGYEMVHQWSEAEEINLIKNFDIGIMPLENSPWEAGKCGYKLIQYMGCGIPVVGTPVGVNDYIIKHGINGYKATTIEEWFVYLDILITNDSDRIKMGKEGRRLAETEFDISGAFTKWVTLLQSNTINA